MIPIIAKVACLVRINVSFFPQRLSGHLATRSIAAMPGLSSRCRHFRKDVTVR
jgi:hypothetical protein